MKKYNKFYNVSLGNFLKVACCSLSIITIASCAEEPLEGEESNSKSDLLKVANDLSSALEKSGSDISIAYMEETDDNPFQKEQKLNIAEEWKKIANDVKNLINEFKKLGKDDFLPPLVSILKTGEYLAENDFNGDLKCLNFPCYGDEDRRKLENDHPKYKVCLVLMDKIKSGIDAFIDKFDKSEQAVGSSSQEESKLNKAKAWEKVKEAAQKLIMKFKSAGKDDNFGDHLKSILEVGERICDNDSYFNFQNDLEGLKCFKFGVSDRKEFEENKDVLDLMDKVESEINDFINKFYKSEPAGDSKVSK